MVMRHPEYANYAPLTSHPEQPRPSSISSKQRLRASARKARGRCFCCSVVELRRVLRRLEYLRVVSIEDLRVVGVADLANALIAAIGVARADRAWNRRDQVLIEVFL